MTVKTRFAPSPTGFLHIGSARTALFNWLFARHHGGEFLLRIEDTDRARSTQPAIEAILDGMDWLGLNPDSEVVYQFARSGRHKEIAEQLLASGHAYKCYTTQEELAAFREQNPHAKFKSPYRDNPTPPAPDSPYAIRIKAPLEGETIIDDQVQGKVTMPNNELDDMIMLRSDGTPTYMLAVVVDDYDMGVTHVIRGDDHLTNAARQSLIYKAMGWDLPIYAHIPLIHGPDGAKMSKRHGALGVDAYRDMGYLPEAMRNYLLRLGWAHGDDEIISTDQAIEWFGLEGLGKSPSRFDFAKLENLNGHYIREADNSRLVELVCHSREGGNLLDEGTKARILAGMDGLKQRAKTIKELAESSDFYITRPALDDKANAELTAGKEVIAALLPALEALSDWNHDTIQDICKASGETLGLKLGKVMGPLRAAITGRTTSPSMFEVMDVLGKQETLNRLKTI